MEENVTERDEREINKSQGSLAVHVRKVLKDLDPCNLEFYTFTLHM